MQSPIQSLVIAYYSQVYVEQLQKLTTYQATK